MKNILILLLVGLSSFGLKAQITVDKISTTPAYEISGVATQNGILVVAYVEDKNPASPSDPGSEKNKAISIKRSIDGGKTWINQRVINSNPNFSYINPDLVVDDNNTLFLAITVIRTVNQDGEIELWKSTDEGVTWTNSGSVYPFNYPILPRLEASTSTANRLYLVFTEVKNGGSESRTRYMRTSNGGTTWTDTLDLSATFGTPNDMGADIGIVRSGRSSFIGVVWSDNSGIQFAKSSNGTSFGGPAIVSNAQKAPLVLNFMRYGRKSSIAMTMHQPGKLGFTYYTASQNRGNTWNIPTQISPKGTMAAGVMDSAGVTHVFYNEIDFNTYRARRRISNANAGALSSPLDFFVPVTLNPTRWVGQNNAVAYDLKNNGIHIFWIDWRNNSGIPSHTSWKGTNTGIEDLKVEILNVYPNPAQNLLRFKSQDIGKVESLMVVDMNGKVVLSQNNGFQLSQGLEISGLAMGTYTIRIISSTGLYQSNFQKL